MRHCCQELCKTRGARALSVVYLHQFQYHVLSQALRYFQDDVQTERTGYVPTLPSSAQPPGVIPQQLCVCVCVFWLYAYTVGLSLSYLDNTSATAETFAFLCAAPRMTRGHALYFRPQKTDYCLWGKQGHRSTNDSKDIEVLSSGNCFHLL